MYETVLNLLWKTSKVKPFNNAFRFFYSLNYRFAKSLLISFSGAKVVYCKGSFVQKTFEPLVSDIDFVLIYERGVRQAKKKVKILTMLMPLVKDADCFKESTFKLRLKYGSLKYQSINSWRRLKGNVDYNTNRLAHPLKYEYDYLREIYFYMEWTYFNLSRPKLSEYRKRCVVRTLEKASSFAASFGITSEAEEAKVEMEQYELRQISMQLFSDLIVQTNFHETLGPLLEYDINEVKNRDYFKSKFSIDNESNTGIPVTLKAFELLYISMVSDPSLIYEHAEKIEDKLLREALFMEYCLLIEEGITNHIHQRWPNSELALLLERAKSYLEKYQRDGMKFRAVEKSLSLDTHGLRGGITYKFKFSLNSKDHELVSTCLRISESHSDDIIYNFKVLDSRTQIVAGSFYSFKNFDSAEFQFGFEDDFESLNLKMMDYNSIDDENEKVWTYVGENKGSFLSEDAIFELLIDGEFGEDWNKAVIRVAGRGVITAEVFDVDYRRISSPRKQEKDGEYLTVFFPPSFDKSKIIVKLTSQHSGRCEYEVVCFKASL